MHKKDLKIGELVGTRTVLRQLEQRKNGYVRYIVECDCGDISTISGSYLRLKQPACRSCSHKKNNKKGKGHYAYKHGMASRTKGRDRIYAVWVALRQRCNDPNDQQYKNYGGRGIYVCKEWDDFQRFYEDMGERPEGMQLDRIDNDGPYCKENCRWADRNTQANNRTTTRMHVIDCKKIKHSDLLKSLGLSRDKFRGIENRKGIEYLYNFYKKRACIEKL